MLVAWVCRCGPWHISSVNHGLFLSMQAADLLSEISVHFVRKFSDARYISRRPIFILKCILQLWSDRPKSSAVRKVMVRNTIILRVE